MLNPHNSDARKRMRAEFGYGEALMRIWKREAGVEWMTDAEGRESIPPVYTEYIGGYVKMYVKPGTTYNLAA